ncbi:MAG TPA: DUF4910 domain-containing protein [Anaerolineae bacterium]|nr:DUF4910 domain-containing protein [Anaerolineae bacterium]
MRCYRETFEQIWSAFSGQAALQTVSDLSRFHRIQASPGHRQAAELLCRRALEAGLQAEILSYPAAEDGSFWAFRSFQEWECRRATLHLDRPASAAGILADFRAVPISVIQRSASFDGQLEVVALDDGSEEAAYEGVDVAGKAVLTSGDVRRVYEHAVEQRGAAGILFDGMRVVPPVRPEGDLLDVRQYTSFWWRPGDHKCFGFVLAPRQGALLRRLLREEQPILVSAHVESRQYDGSIEVVSATIPGAGDQQVLVVAHLCHPSPSANDNASGAAAALEAACTLQGLISSGRLPSPARTLRFLWLPEMTGTAAYLSAHEHELSRTVAAVNLDMVGEDQGQTGSSWLIERPPEAAASFAPELLSFLREAMPGLKGMSDVSPSHTGAGEFALYRHAETAFSGGSDHYILSDPSVGIPSPMLIQWPDRFYHTSADTPDRTDPRSLARSGALAAAYAYWVASAGVEEAAELGLEMVARFKGALAQTAQAAVSEAMLAEDSDALSSVLVLLDRRLAYRLDRQKAALRTLERLAPLGSLLLEMEAELERTAEREMAWAQAAMEHAWTGFSQLGRKRKKREPGEAVEPPQPRSATRHATPAEQEAGGLVPERKLRGPIPLQDHIWKLDAEERRVYEAFLAARKEISASSLTTLALYWADGKRTLLEIADLVEMESGTRDPELLVAYFRLLEKLGLVALH